MTIKEAKELDMVDYLSKLGFEPQEKKGIHYWYHSPFRDEKTASFKVNTKMNRWYDWGEGRGGNLVDFGVLYFNCSVAAFLQRLDTPDITIHPQQQRKGNPNMEGEENREIIILSVHPITSFALIRYLKDRRIAYETAEKYLQEVRYRNGEKTYYALGFKNNSGGYELRSEHFKGSSSPKGVTFLNNGTREVAVFEGCFDFLSYRMMLRDQSEPPRNFLILNSTSFFGRSIPILQAHDHVYLYLDHDTTGQNCTRKMLAMDPEKYSDERKLYQGHKDLNEWLIHIGRSPEQRLRQQL